MNSSVPGKTSAPGAEAAQPATVARAAIKRLAEQRLPPTPENFARAYEDIASTLAGVLPSYEAQSGVLTKMADLLAQTPAGRGVSGERLKQALKAQSWTQASEALAEIEQKRAQREGKDLSWPDLFSLLIPALDRAHKEWTPAKKRDSVLRVAETSRSDAAKLFQRLTQLMQSWESGGRDQGIERNEAPPPAMPQSSPPPSAVMIEAVPTLAATLQDASTHRSGASSMLVLLESMKAQIPDEGAVADEVRLALDEAAQELRTERLDVSTPTGQARLRRLCERVERVHAQRQRLLTLSGDVLNTLCDNADALVEDESWVRGQVQAMRAQLEMGLNRQTLTTARALLRETGQRQASLKKERETSQQALKHMLALLLERLGQMGDKTGHYYERMGTYVQEIESASGLDQLNEVVRNLLSETQEMRDEVGSTRREMTEAHQRAVQFERRVKDLEAELSQVSEKMLTDHLTQALNRRGLEHMFAAEISRANRNQEPFSLALLDVDDFKLLNDQFGHQTGDEALVFLTRTLKSVLRPTDIIARYGGEEFVVLLPATETEQAAAVMVRVQRALTAAIFMQNERHIVMTFSAGIALYRTDEPLSTLLARADDALYEAKLAGKNRVSIAGA